MTTTAQVISKEDLLKHWQGHRNLTRRVIELFPQKDFFEFSIGGMRTFAQLTSELLAIASPGLKGIVNRKVEPFSEEAEKFTTKEQFLKKWDESTAEINDLWEQLSMEDFSDTFNLFGQYEFPIIQNILYFIGLKMANEVKFYIFIRKILMFCLKLLDFIFSDQILSF